MIVTTAGKFNEKLIQKALTLCEEVQGTFVYRKNRSIASLQEQGNDYVLMVGVEKLTLYAPGSNEPVFFHPNSSMFRVKQLLRREHDPLVAAAQLTTGMTVLDCTVGLASDAIVCSLAVGETGSVTGIEKNPYLALLVREGLRAWDSSLPEMNEAMRRIVIETNDHLTALKKREDASVDVVYFDPMFEQSLDSPGLAGLKTVAAHTTITEEVLHEALRVAKCRVVMKDHYASSRFQAFPFHVYKRPSSKFHYGVIEKEARRTM
ncbi:hypothetical protein A374_04544 [Fictibacillus macauensis ZFHKF-1]|uniref:SAM-dependent methyltransferase n=1 Tax=Fictibacillus macauensis ZFHKF-1 TaxID=1196324 RepID=I8UJ07_9BACL|nr:class I SAM-dependent methyltransferase [Fictibacillus macauensis]EIT86813.1 hypothetical protein A374_04544 [Fictibacillus macauensis ZFHKF-1]